VDSLKKQNEDSKVGLLVLSTAQPLQLPYLVETLKNAQTILVLGPRRQHLESSDLLATQIKAAFSDAWTRAEGFPRVGCLADAQLSENLQEEAAALTEALQSDHGKRTLVIGEPQAVALEKSKR